MELENDIHITNMKRGLPKASSLPFRVFNDATDPCHNKPSIKRDFVMIIIPRKGCNLRGTDVLRFLLFMICIRFKCSAVCICIKINH